MRGFSKKILISLLTTLVVFITVFATTYAWVGIFTYANTDSFKMNLKVQDLDSNYFLTISSSGKPGTFSNEVPAIDIERQVLANKYGDSFKTKNDLEITETYKRLTFAPVTTNLNNNYLDDFKALDYGNYFRLVKTDAYLKFNLYLSVDTKEGISSDTTGIRANVLLNNIEDTLTGTISNGTLLNGNPFIELPSSPINDLLKSIPDRYNIDSKNSVRFSISLYEPIEINSEYSNEEPLLTKIYQGGKSIPSYDSYSNVYDLGGCLELENNLAAQELLVIRPNYNKETSDLFYESLNNSIERNDLELIELNKDLWNKHDHSDVYLGCMNGIQTKMKLEINMWFEGWDADCLRTIVDKPVTLNLTFTSGTDD